MCNSALFRWMTFRGRDLIDDQHRDWAALTTAQMAGTPAGHRTLILKPISQYCRVPEAQYGLQQCYILLLQHFAVTQARFAAVKRGLRNTNIFSA
jgi:hypothetical protein